MRSFIHIIVLLATGTILLAQATNPATEPFSRPTTRDVNPGPRIVTLKELANLYDPVPFDHQSHAAMSQMWNGCSTCHHRPPSATTMPAHSLEHPTQQQAALVPACKSCHPANMEEANIHMPNLRGAYHRQCLNCHREWMHGNACVVCHRPRDGRTVAAPQVSKDDIIGRMHPPIPEPEIRRFKTRFTPADGNNVLFRHKEHSRRFSLKCAGCHRNDSCANCHDGKPATMPANPALKPARTWAESHGACMACHQTDHCNKCHYKDEQPAPPPFDHQSITGQALDKDHQDLACWQCHVNLKLKVSPTCGDASCHKRSKQISFPARRPGPFKPSPHLPTTRRALPHVLPSTRRAIPEVP